MGANEVNKKLTMGRNNIHHSIYIKFKIEDVLTHSR